MVRKGTRRCQRVPEGVDDARGCQRVPDGTREGARGFQMVGAEGSRGC